MEGRITDHKDPNMVRMTADTAGPVAKVTDPKATIMDPDTADP